MVIINAFLSGLLYILYILSEGWFWIFALAGMFFIAFIENKNIETQYVDDERKLM